MLNRRLHRLVCVYTCQTATLLEITYRGSYVIDSLDSVYHRIDEELFHLLVPTRF